MPATIKTQLLQQLVVSLATASDLVTVERFPAKPTDLDQARAPIAYIQEGVPEVRASNGRFYRGILQLDIMVFIELQSIDADNGNVTFMDKADEIQGQMHAILLGTGQSNLTGFALRVLERSVEKLIVNSEWGVLIWVVEVTYQHLTGDAFSKS